MMSARLTEHHDRSQTQAMMISTQHLLPSALPAPPIPQEIPPVAQSVESQEPGSNGAQAEATSAEVGGDNASGTATAPATSTVKC